MARRTFFSFHYTNDVGRAHVLRNTWVTKEDRKSAGFYDSSVFEASKKESDEALKAFLRDGLKNSSVTCIAVGAETSTRPWVRYEIIRSFQRGNGILAVGVHGIRNFNKQLGVKGSNPLNSLAFCVTGERVHWKEKIGDQWKPYTGVPTMALSDVPYDLGSKTNHTFSSLFPLYDYAADDGYNNLGRWIEAAANQAGR